MDNSRINKENKGIWDANAAKWDSYMGEGGNDWHKELVAPKTEHLLNLNAGQHLLDIGCGNGLFARRIAKKNVNVTAFDFSEQNINNALKYDSSNIDYQVIDASKSEDLLKLQGVKFDALVANMVLMDMPDLEVLFNHIKFLLHRNGVFVFSIQHPCFNSELTEINESSITVNGYIEHDVSKGIAIPKQERKQFYFHRPISYYINLGIQNGLIVSGYEEPIFNNTDNVFGKIPPILILKMEFKK